MEYREYGSPMGEKVSERARWTPLTRMLLSGEMTQERQKELTTRERFDRWMINEGYRRVFVLSPRPPLSPSCRHWPEPNN